MDMYRLLTQIIPPTQAATGQSYHHFHNHHHYRPYQPQSDKFNDYQQQALQEGSLVSQSIKQTSPLNTESQMQATDDTVPTRIGNESRTKHTRTYSPRYRYSNEQIRTLEATYKRTPFLDMGLRQRLSHFLHLPDDRIRAWFQNRRNKQRYYDMKEHKHPKRSLSPSPSYSSAFSTTSTAPDEVGVVPYAELLPPLITSPSHNQPDCPLDLSLPKLQCVYSSTIWDPLKKKAHSRLTAQSPPLDRAGGISPDKIARESLPVNVSNDLFTEMSPSTCLLRNCGYPITSLRQEDAHILFHHSNVNIWPCPLCHKSFKKYFFLKNHFWLHHEQEQELLQQ